MGTEADVRDVACMLGAVARRAGAVWVAVTVGCNVGRTGGCRVGLVRDSDCECAPLAKKGAPVMMGMAMGLS